MENNMSCDKPYEKPCEKPCDGQLCNLCIGYAYVPMQSLGELYDECTALNVGTIFPGLNLTIDCYGNICKETGGICDE